MKHPLSTSTSRLRLALAALASAALALPCAAALADLFSQHSATSAAPAAASAVIAETLLSDGSTNAWTQADLVAALGLLNRRYRRDIETESGRKAWHGAETMQTLMTNDAGLVFMRRTYADGFTWDDKARTPTASQAASNAVRAVQALLATKGVSPRLAALRTKAAAALSTTETTITATVDAAANAPVRIAYHARNQFDEYGVITNSIPDGRTEWYVELGADGEPRYRCVRYDATNGLVRTSYPKRDLSAADAARVLSGETQTFGEASGQSVTD